ncbi:GtrA family protein [Microbulbifer salipaludis]|uniref:GtrA family protein n=1 Tax=Microbulbifer salipaludis TaxID=187980 RepID=A0ABS3EA68_9GAMM|nr:GtrA family protein [Microbulbifer salipaludis]MBN8432190.1 GtrA family protein [Microbulbifer salipaludis]
MRLPEYIRCLLPRAVRFAAVGGVATAIQYTVLVLLVELFGVVAIAASALAYGLSALANYLLNYHFTFGGAVEHSRSLPKFVAVAVVGLAINTLCFALAATQLPYLAAQVVATLVTLAGNFLLHQYWVYREPKWNP